MQCHTNFCTLNWKKSSFEWRRLSQILKSSCLPSQAFNITMYRYCFWCFFSSNESENSNFLFFLQHSFACSHWHKDTSDTVIYIFYAHGTPHSWRKFVFFCFIFPFSYICIKWNSQHNNSNKFENMFFFLLKLVIWIHMVLNKMWIRT